MRETPAERGFPACASCHGVKLVSFVVVPPDIYHAEKPPAAVVLSHHLLNLARDAFQCCRNPIKRKLDIAQLLGMLAIIVAHHDTTRSLTGSGWAGAASRSIHAAIAARCSGVSLIPSLWL